MRQITSLLLIILFSTSASAERILIISDPQYGWFARRDCKTERQNFQKIINIANRETFDAVFILGDLADSYPKTVWRRKAQINLFLEDVSKIKNTRVFFVPGNHDMGEHPTAQTVEKFQENFGVPPWYAFRLGEHKFIVINTTLLKNSKRLPHLYDEQMKFIKENGDAKFVLGHHPPFHKKYDEISGYYNWPKNIWRAISPLFQKGTFFLSGHTHRRFELFIQDFHIINPGTCCAPWKNGITSYGILEINGPAIRYQGYKLP